MLCARMRRIEWPDVRMAVGKKTKAAFRCHWCPSANEEMPLVPLCDASAVTLPEKPVGAVDPVPLNTPLFLWHDGSFHIMPTTAAGYSIPKVRHVTGPCWHAQLGNIKELITALQTKSEPYGWSLCYWSHEAMDEEMRKCGDNGLREAYFAIDPAYKAARSDLFRPYVLYKHGGMWLDLRGVPARDDKGIGLEGVTEHFNGMPPPLVFCYGGQHKEKFNGLHGEMINGFMMSAPELEGLEVRLGA